MRATGIGSMPGEDIDAALAAVFDELPDLPYLPELPARGPGSDMIGRTAAALVDLHIDLQPAGWRFVARPGLDERRAADRLEADLDALVPIAGSYDGVLKVQLTGPWTLAAAVDHGRGRVVGDAGAVRDLVDSLAETVTAHLAEVARRVPAARLVLQLDEPSLPGVLDGRVETASGLGRLPAIAASTAADALRRAVAAAGTTPVVVHCCAADVPVRVVADAGASAVSFDLSAAVLDRDVLGEAVDGGLDLWLGVVPSLGPGVPPTPGSVAAPVRRLWHELGFDPSLLDSRVALTPACGLAGASEGWARTAMRLVRQAARILADSPEVVA